MNATHDSLAKFNRRGRLDINPPEQMAAPVAPSALEALIRLPVVEQVADAVHAVLEERGGCGDDHAGLRIDKRNDIQCEKKRRACRRRLVKFSAATLRRTDDSAIAPLPSVAS